MNQVQERQEELYNILISLNNQNPDFTFWLTRGEYRFNRGQDDDGKNIYSGYTNVGIVKLVSHSKLQWAGLHFSNNYSTCEFSISTRKDDYRSFVNAAAKIQEELTIQQVQAFCENVIAQMGNYLKTSYPFTSVEWKNWIFNLYNRFYTIVKTYDEHNNTSFYKILKIDPATFKRKKSNSDMKKGTTNKEAEIANKDNGVTNTNDTLSTIPLNQILYGPPGTGKTYNTVVEAIKILEPNESYSSWEEKKKRFDYYKAPQQGQIVFTTFHQSMSYEDFVEGIKPGIDDKTRQVTYDVKPGIFKELCKKASKEENKDKKFVLIIDEINRGNVSQIFGELITLLEEDKRLGKEFGLEVKLPYSPDDFGIPSNLHIIGTMNTADRSVEALDTALRRRFSFVEMMPKPELLNDIECDVNLEDVLKTINERIAVLKDREHQIGHSYFMKHKEKPDEKISLSPEELKAIFKNKIVPLLQEYFYGNYENIRRVLGDGFVRKNNPVTFADGTLSDVDTEQPQYRLLTEEEWNRTNIRGAVHQLLNESSTPKEDPPVQEVIPELT